MSKSPTRHLTALTAAQVNTLLAVAVIGAVVTGLVSWAVGTEWARLWTFLHAAFGVMVLVLTPAKANGSVRVGLRRGRTSRWVSLIFAGLILAIIVLGLLHGTGLWYGVGYWTSLWTHFLLAFVAVPLLLWHMLARPVRTRAVNLDRRMFLGGGVAAGIAATTVGAVELGTRAVGAAGGDRRFTGSHEIGSFDPQAMPVVSWINDRRPTLDPDDWPFTVGGIPVDLDPLRGRVRAVEAALDCTGGWWSNQSWDVISFTELFESIEPVGDLDPRAEVDRARSVLVRSATGYQRLFPLTDADQTFLAFGYNREPLRRGHGAPVRIVAPGRRGPWWVKWVTEIELSDRRWWLQLPFPAD
ncbi:MAG: molybdopterin-dependent oxidoreductase [Actinomycetota bacterium]